MSCFGFRVVFRTLRRGNHPYVLRMLVVQIAAAVDAIDRTRNHAHVAFMVGIGASGAWLPQAGFRLSAVADFLRLCSYLRFPSILPRVFLALLGQIFRDVSLVKAIILLSGDHTGPPAPRGRSVIFHDSPPPPRAACRAAALHHVLGR